MGATMARRRQKAKLKVKKTVEAKKEEVVHEEEQKETSRKLKRK